MNADLVNELKARLVLADLVRDSGVELKACSRRGDFVGCCPFHAEKTGSFNVHPTYFKCFGCGISGDVLHWLAFKKFGRKDVDGAEFIEVLREGCQIAGVAFPERDEAPGVHAARERRRAVQSILTRYLEVAEAARTAEFYVRAIQRKSYLTREVIERWRLGNAPSLSACLEAGLTEKELRSVRLLCDPHEDGPDARSYMFFRDSIIIPYLERGSVTYLSSRYLSDVDGRGVTRTKKTLHLGTNEDVKRPCGFNLDAIRDRGAELVGLLLVEGPLDAIACSEREHPAVAMLGARPAVELVRMLA